MTGPAAQSVKDRVVNIPDQDLTHKSAYNEIDIVAIKFAA